VAEAKNAECEYELKKVEPIAEAAQKAVNQLDAKDITEMRQFKTVGPPVKAVAQCLVFYFKLTPKQYIMATSADGKSKAPDFWETCKKHILPNNLKKNLQEYPKDDLGDELAAQIQPILDSEEFTDEKLSKASKAAFGIAKWCRAIVGYHGAMKIVIPRQLELKEAKASAAAAEKAAKAAQEKLDAINAEMNALVDQLTATQNEENRLRSEKDDCERKVDLAKALINGLAAERENWKVDLAKNRSLRENIVGDILISSGVIAYLGVFLKSYRDECTNNWAEMLKQFNIKSTPDTSVEKTLGDAVRIRQWQIQGLPQDSFSTDSAIICDESERWCLFIDPQMQANIWLKNRHKEDDVRIVKPTQDPNVISRTLENCITIGNPVIFEDANETFDPLLDPLLAKQIEKKGTDYYIKFGESGILFNPDFKFYITTKMSRPHYQPEICVKVTMLNFMVTQEGLYDQMLSIIVKIEEFQKYTRRNDCIQIKADNQKKQAELQDKILNLVANSQDDILEDRELKVTLDESKVQSV
jgi:dynein heavy chain, axonemal